MAHPKRLTALPSWLVSQAALRAQRAVADELGRAGYGRRHYAVLAALEENGPATQAELGRSVWLHPSDLHAVVKRLEDDALVMRARDERDRRRKVVGLTPAGSRALKRLDVRVTVAQERLLEPLSSPERRELLRLLARLVERADPD